MNFEQFAMAGFVLIGLTNGVQMAINKDWGSFAKFMIAVIAGGIFGYLNMFGLPGLEMGLAVGVSSSGVYKIAQKLGGE